jgi:hypothetical protein
LASAGAASLFGVTSISDVLARVDHAVKGRLLVFFQADPATADSDSSMRVKAGP